MKKNTPLQYTIRNIPGNVDRVLRRRSRLTGKSFNQVALEALASATGEPLKPSRDLSFIVGSLSAREADEQDAEISAQRKIDPKLWKKA